MNKYTQLGKITWLWMNSPMHKAWPIDLLTKFVIPAIEHESYILYERDDVPVGYCSWTYFNIESEAKYITNPDKLKLVDWNSGDRLWFLDCIAPFGKKDIVSLKKIIAYKFKNSIARSLRVKTNNKKGLVKEYKGANLVNTEAQIQFEKYNAELKDHLKHQFKNKC